MVIPTGSADVSLEYDVIRPKLAGAHNEGWTGGDLSRQVEKEISDYGSDVIKNAILKNVILESDGVLTKDQGLSGLQENPEPENIPSQVLFIKTLCISFSKIVSF